MTELSIIVPVYKEGAMCRIYSKNDAYPLRIDIVL